MPLDTRGSGRVSTNGNTIRSGTEKRNQIIKGFYRVLAGSGIDSSGFRGLSHYAMGEYDDAFEAFLEYNQIDRDNPEILALQASSLLKLERMEDALQVCETALRDGKGTFEIRKIQCNIFERMGRWEDTLRACDEALTLNPHSVEICSLKARALYCLNRNQEALQSCEFALRIDPTSAELLQQKTLLLAYTGKVSDKGEFFEPAPNEGKDGSGIGKGGWLS
jgi:tetratricopeptide (TPR) repeat protein